MTDAQYSSIIWLTQGRYSIVDNKDYEYLNQWSWQFHRTRGGFNGYAQRKPLKREEDKKQLKLHRYLLNAPVNLLVDHINGNGLDNRRENLRLCTNHENQQNQKKWEIWGKRPTTSKYKGVCWKKSNRLWVVKVQKRHYGYFNCEVQAAEKYDEVAEKLYGEFALTNKMLGLLPQC
jgi:hypothetical protein